MEIRHAWPQARHRLGVSSQPFQPLPSPRIPMTDKPPETRRPWDKSGRKPYGAHGGKPWTKHRPQRPAAPPEPIDDDTVRLFGAHAVEAALANDARVIKKLALTENGERRLAELIAKRGITVERVLPKELDRILGADTVHQGMMLETGHLPEPELAELAERAVTGGPLILFDQITDPHNGGAILRSAAAFGAAGIVMTRRHSPPLNGTLAKSASGALELVPIALVQNLARAMDELKGMGVKLIGLDGSAADTLEDEVFTGTIGLVLGAEGKGLRQLTAENCDRLVRIATSDTLASLNVSNAAAISLHWIATARARAR